MGAKKIYFYIRRKFIYSYDKVQIKEQFSNGHTSYFDYVLYNDFLCCNIIYAFHYAYPITFLQNVLQKIMFEKKSCLPLKLLL